MQKFIKILISKQSLMYFPFSPALSTPLTCLLNDFRDHNTIVFHCPFPYLICFLNMYLISTTDGIRIYMTSVLMKFYVDYIAFLLMSYLLCKYVFFFILCKRLFLMIRRPDVMEINRVYSSYLY